jgi:hypothetical protein
MLSNGSVCVTGCFAEDRGCVSGLNLSDRPAGPGPDRPTMLLVDLTTDLGEKSINLL